MVGLDVAPAMVAACQIAAAEAGLGNTRVVSGDAQAPDPALFTPYLPPPLLEARTEAATGPFATDEGVAGPFDAAGFSQVQTVDVQLETRFEDVAQSSPPQSAGELLSSSLHPDGRYVTTQTVRYTVGVRA